MSSDEDKSFQCQELGHMACYCPCVFIVMIMAMSQQIAQKKPHHQVYQPDTETTILTQDDVTDPPLGIIIEIGTITVTIEIGIGLTGQDPIHTVIDTGVTAAVTYKEFALGPITNQHAAAHHITEAQAHTATNETPNTADPHHKKVFPEIAVDPDHVHHTNTTTKHQQDHLTVSTEQPGKPRDKKHKQVTIDDPPSEYYSSDEQASKSDDVLNQDSPLLAHQPTNGEGCPRRTLLSLHT